MSIGQIFSQLVSSLIRAGEPLDDETLKSTMQDARDISELGDYERDVDTYRGKSQWLNR